MSTDAPPSPVDFVTRRGGPLRGRLRVPGDKSISHRALMLGALAEGTTEIEGFLEGEDCCATLAALRAMGVEIEGPSGGRVRVRGVGASGLRAPAGPLDCGNSGTSMRLLAGLLAGARVEATLVGDASLSRRPMGRVVTPLGAMGAILETGPEQRPPLRVRAGARLRGITYALPMASAQVKSAVLLAGLGAEGRTVVEEPAPTRDHTERMLEAFGYPLERTAPRVALRGGGRLVATRVEVPADFSSASFFLVAASIVEGSDLTLEGVGVNPSRAGALEILRLMGARVEVDDERQQGGEPVADIRVRAAPLHGIRIPEALVPLAIDEFPALFVAAACAEGETVLTGAGELRVKESDRIQVMADGLRALGVKADPTPDGLRVRGGPLSGGRVRSQGDHRVAMAFAVAGSRAEGPVHIEGCGPVRTSFPSFETSAEGAGLNLEVVRG